MNTREAKTHLSRLLATVELGEEIVIARNGKPVARLVPLRNHIAFQCLEPLGRGIWEDEWDSDDTYAEVADLFETSKLYPDEAVD